MKLYLLDWGKQRGARFAVIQAKNEESLLLAVDAIGCAEDVKAIEINNGHDGGFYVELMNPDDKEHYCNVFNDSWDEKNYAENEELPSIYDSENRKEWFEV